MSITLVWEGEVPSDVEAVATAVIAELQELMPDLDFTPAHLLIHTIQLTSDMEGPTVMVSGAEGDDRFFCTYYPTMRWVDVGRTPEGRRIEIPELRTDEDR